MSDDALHAYRKKRDFSRTSEPEGGSASGDQPTFVVQKHAARRLHYDVRLEVDGVMPSWAVPKGPSYDPKVKRLAVHVEDHPLDYQSFEGTIPAGEYGGGAVVVWDAGTYRNLTERDGRPVGLRQAIEDGHVSVWLEGEKLRGGWSLTRTSGPPGARPAKKPLSAKESWIMVKRRDETADPELDITADRPESLRTGRTVEAVGAEAVGAAPAAFVEPMLAELARTVPTAAGWVFERKLDGLRCVAVRHGSAVGLWSRNRLSFNARFPDLVDAVRDLPADDFVLDGEIVAMDAAGQTSFGLVQRRGSGAIPELHVFDLLHLLGTDTRQLPLLERKALLSVAVPDGTGVHVVDHHEGDPEVLLVDACRRGWEGLIAKRAESRYRGGRSADWKKLKCSASQELVIGGWTEPRGARSGFGALLVGVYDPTGLRYAGKVGTGFDTATLASLYLELLAREAEASPFVDRVREPTAHWARPELVANVAFTEWTGDAKLRHPRFEGLRPDKDPHRVVRERPVTT
ncbi:MAG: hypothetical protein NVS3B12_22480 [Acidimicrobiales bacterium]